MCFPTANTALNSCQSLKDESCSLVYSLGKLFVLFFLEAWPDCKKNVIQNGLNIHNVSSTSSFRIQLTLVDLDPKQVSPELVQHWHMTCMKLSIRADNDAKDAMRVPKLGSNLGEFFWSGVYGNHERLGLGRQPREYRLRLLSKKT